jgi:glycosyltransferase involved in cell wall biosynthesis
MAHDKSIAVVMPAYNAERTLERTFSEVKALNTADYIIVVDDFSHDATVEIASKLQDAIVLRHDSNRGYGANQKTCYRAALDLGAEIIIMLHADYQYTPRLIPAMASVISSGLYPCVLGSRILGGGALTGGMPRYKYCANRALTLIQNALCGSKLSEFHTGYRAFSRDLLLRIDFEKNSDDFLFDNQLLAQILWLDQPIAEITCPTSYFPEASSINFARSVKYGFGCLETSIAFRLCKMGLWKSRLFPLPAKASARPSIKAENNVTD